MAIGIGAKRRVAHGGRAPLVAVGAAIAYPFLLVLFHQSVGTAHEPVAANRIMVAALALVCATLVPAIGLWAACRPELTLRARRLAYATVIAPTMYVFLGVSQGLLGIPIPDTVTWCIVWIGLTCLAYALPQRGPETFARPDLSRVRVVHGVTAAILCLYVLFHIGNHLASLRGPEAHAAIMAAGRTVYRNPVVEPVLVATMLFQVVTGLYLAWRWSAARHDFYRTFQIASGIYLSLFIVGHMNSVFIYARTVQHIPTDWTFATGTAAGLIHDPWNIRLVPHYALGVFFVLSHLLSGLRVVALAHGVSPATANRLWKGGAMLCACLGTIILAGLCGLRI